jgi:hypothetical protein
VYRARLLLNTSTCQKQEVQNYICMNTLDSVCFRFMKQKLKMLITLDILQKFLLEEHNMDRNIRRILRNLQKLRSILRSIYDN